MNSQQIGAVVLIAGSLICLITAFGFPSVTRVYVEQNQQNRIEILDSHQSAWKVHNFLFLLGSTLTVIGLALLAIEWRNTAQAALLYAAVFVLLIGVVLWDWHLGLRITDPVVFATGEVPLWMFAGFSFLTMLGLALFGSVYLQMGLPGWLGWLHIGGMTVLLLLALIFRDMPPFAYYLFTLTAGIVLLRTEVSI